MNQHYLMEHISRHLHTLVRRYSSDWKLIDFFCARTDLKDDHIEPLLAKYFSTLDFSCNLPIFLLLNQQIVYACIPTNGEAFLLGPLSFSSPVNIRRKYTVSPLDNLLVALIPHCSFRDFITDVLLITNLFHHDTVSEEEILQKNCIPPQIGLEFKKEHTAYTFKNREICRLHNPYDQEVREFTSIENGNIEELQNSLLEDYPGEIGTLAKDPLRHMKNRGIVVVALASRAAIRGGMLPEEAYSLSDSYIQKIEDCNDILTILHLFHDAEYHYAQIVHDLKLENTPSKTELPNIYTEKCKTYIFSHLHGRIYVQDIAQELNLNANYLSELFHKHEGITLSKYILKEKMKLTKNLLTYSKYTYSEIATYLGYSSQSHLGKQFKQSTGMTLHQYRNTYGTKYF